MNGIITTYNHRKRQYTLTRADGSVVTLQADEANSIFEAVKKECRREDLFLRLRNVRNNDGTYEIGWHSVSLTSKQRKKLVEASLDDFDERCDNAEEWPDNADGALSKAYKNMKGANNCA